MGKQAKLKKMRQQAKQNPSPESPNSPQETDPKNFVKNFEQQGYKFNAGLSSPEIPNPDSKPQV